MSSNEGALLVVEDDRASSDLLVRLLERAGYRGLMTASSAQEARAVLAQKEVDLVLTDMQMPGASGLDLLIHLQDNLPRVATLMVTATDDIDLADEAAKSGAYGYIVKPFRKSEVLNGVRNALRRRDLELENQHHRDNLEETVRLRTEDLWKALVRVEQSEDSVRISRTETIERLAIAAEFRDEETGFHLARMSRYCEILASECGDEFLRRNIREASSLHDVGKIGIPDRILLKSGTLLPSERLVMQGHAAIGHRILRDSESPLLKLAAEIALSHHEKVDGTGYPNGLVGDAIPLAGRIAAIADVFDALTSNRVYRSAFALPEAVEMMTKSSGEHFDADLLTIFWRVMPDVFAVASGSEGLSKPGSRRARDAALTRGERSI